ncbi:hypothetical protein [Fluviispira sanaruensis]|uniref:Uncharacterized protein n=1 Tax=Fluviispira sanaruensis TaxID=2493639 RepID=A0A4P2VW69_FLUSA|nr:hypothetical protein [Fluviispira sanaruensis]BBH53835.1 hypothetical protein JCM31447_22870 [Fluviispira sanaruensis]
MLQNENMNEKELESWKKTIKNHFETFSLTKDKKNELELLLLKSDNFSHRTAISHNKLLNLKKFKGILIKNQKFIFSHLGVAAIAAIVTFATLEGFESNNHDILSEMAFLPDSESLPADFDLVGDAAALPQLTLESLPNQAFKPVIPKKIAQKYEANEGRFFYLKGQQGVSISMKPLAPTLPHSTSEIHSTRPSTLYIVKLSQKNENAFPKQRVLRKITSSTGKVRRVYAWQDGAYGYAIVQPQNISDGSLSADPFQTSEENSPLSP